MKASVIVTKTTKQVISVDINDDTPDVTKALTDIRKAVASDLAKEISDPDVIVTLSAEVTDANNNLTFLTDVDISEC